MLAPWHFDSLSRTAVGRSVSRRTDVPALYAEWFLERMKAGFAEYEPAGPPRRIRCSLRPEDLTHFNFWTKWPRPFFPVLGRLLDAGYPALWNVTITGLGATAVEPGVPAAATTVRAVADLVGMVGQNAVQWRYDPIFVSAAYPIEYHLGASRRLAGELAGHVDRVAVSFLIPFARRVAPHLRKYESATGDRVAILPLAAQLDLLGALRELASAAGIRFTVCCSPALQDGAGCEVSGCNSWEWLRRVYPVFARDRRRPARGKNGCACGREIDIGAYDTCTLGCVYSYGTCDRARARGRFASHRPEAAGIASSPFPILL